jgi:hypothetical protein
MTVREILFVIFTSLLALPSHAQKVPHGWRLVLQSDLGVDPDFRSPRDFQARGDFNGDGRIDHARILIRKSDRNSLALFVFMTHANGQQASVKLHECPTGCGDFVVSIVPSGCYHEEMSGARVCLRHQGLVHIEAEYGFGTLYWLEQGNWRSLSFAQATLNSSPR